MGYERVETHRLEGVRRLRAWSSGGVGHWKYRQISYGTVGGHGWFVERIGQAWSGAWLVPDERAACEAVERWMRGRDWTPTPASFGPDGKPRDGLVWYRSGGSWLPGPGPTADDADPE